MNKQILLEEAQVRYSNGYSKSRIVDYVFENANKDTQAKKILSVIFQKPVV